MKKRPPRVTLYTTRGCPHCRAAQAMLRRLGVPFRAFDIGHNRRAMVEFQRAGGRGVPLIRVGEQILRGFDPRRLTVLLRRSGFHV